MGRASGQNENHNDGRADYMSQDTGDLQDPSNEKLLDGLREDPEDDPREFIPIIEPLNTTPAWKRPISSWKQPRTSSNKNGRRARP